MLDREKVRDGYLESERAVRLAHACDELHGDVMAVDDIGNDVIRYVRIRLKQFAIRSAHTLGSRSAGTEAGGSLDRIRRVKRNDRLQIVPSDRGDALFHDRPGRKLRSSRVGTGGGRIEAETYCRPSFSIHKLVLSARRVLKF